MLVYASTSYSAVLSGSSYDVGVKFKVSNESNVSSYIESIRVLGSNNFLTCFPVNEYVVIVGSSGESYLFAEDINTIVLNTLNFTVLCGNSDGSSIAYSIGSKVFLICAQGKCYSVSTIFIYCKFLVSIARRYTPIPAMVFDYLIFVTSCSNKVKTLFNQCVCAISLFGHVIARFCEIPTQS